MTILELARLNDSMQETCDRLSEIADDVSEIEQTVDPRLNPEQSILTRRLLSKLAEAACLAESCSDSIQSEK